LIKILRHPCRRFWYNNPTPADNPLEPTGFYAILPYNQKYKKTAKDINLTNLTGKVV